MPIGASIGGAVIGAGGAILGSSKAAKAQTQAAQSAADTSLQVAQQNNDLYRQIYGQNTALAAPYYNNGLLAGNALTDLLLGTHTYNPAVVANPSVPGGGTLSQFPANGGTGTGGSTAPSNYAQWAGQAWSAIAPQIGPKRTAEALAISDPVARLNFITSHFDPDEAAIYNQWVAANPPANATAAKPPGTPTTPALTSGQATTPALSQAPGAAAGGMSAINARRAERGLPPVGRSGTATPAAGGGTTAAPSAQNAWDQFRQGTNYQWRLGQGLNAVNSGWAAKGMLDSGAAEKAIVQYGQNFASNELSNYMNLLASQQAAGLSAAGAVMGVGTQYAGNVAAQNTSAANAAANAALQAGQGKANMWGTIGGAAGNIGGALFQYGMGGAPTQAAIPANTGYNTNTGGTSNYFAAHPFG